MSRNNKFISNNRHHKFGTNRTIETLNRSNGKCWYCGIELLPPPKNGEFISEEDTEKIFTVDHLIPISKGGTKDRANLVGSCRYCNNQKGDGDIDFLRMRMLIKTKRWPKFNQPEYEFLLSKGINLGRLEPYLFYFERMNLK